MINLPLLNQSYQSAFSLHWRHNDHDGVTNHQPQGCLLNHLFRRRSKKTSKLRVTGLCVGISPGPCFHLMTSSCANKGQKSNVTWGSRHAFDLVLVCCSDAKDLSESLYKNINSTLLFRALDVFVFTRTKSQTIYPGDARHLKSLFSFVHIWLRGIHA